MRITRVSPMNGFVRGARTTAALMAAALAGPALGISLVARYEFDASNVPSYLMTGVASGSPFTAPDAFNQGRVSGYYWADHFNSDPGTHAFKFSLTLQDNKRLDLETVQVICRTTAGGPTACNVYYSDDGFRYYPLATGQVGFASDGAWHLVSVTRPSTVSVRRKVYFEIVGYGATSSAAHWDVDRVVVMGAMGSSMSVAMDTHVALRRSDGVTGYWEITGSGTTWSPLSLPGTSWRIRGIDLNRVLLQNGDGGTIGYWDFTGDPVTWTRISGPVPGVIARDLYCDRVLLQVGDVIGLWFLNAAGQVTGWAQVSGPMPGWTARAMQGDLILLQQGDGGRSGFWQLDTALNRPMRWTQLSGPMPGWVIRDFSYGRVLLQQGEGGISGFWNIEDGPSAITWQLLSGPMPGWTIGPFEHN